MIKNNEKNDYEFETMKEKIKWFRSLSVTERLHVWLGHLEFATAMMKKNKRKHATT